MQKDAKPYLLMSVLIIRKNIYPLFLILASSTLLVIPYIQNPPNIFFIFLGFVLTFFLYPSVYGQYAEITMNNRKRPYTVLFKRHCLNFIVVSIILVSPIMILSLLSGVFEIDSRLLKFVYSILISSLSLYVFPLLFIHGGRWESIKVGFQCVVGNFSFNLPLIIIASATTALTFIFGQSESIATNIYSLLAYGFFFATQFCSRILAFCISDINTQRQRPCRELVDD